MARYALRRFGVSATEAEAIAQGLRGRSAAAQPGSGGASGRGVVERRSATDSDGRPRPDARQRPTSVTPVIVA